MDKLKMHSVNKVDENIEKIAKLFPNTLTEVNKGYREDGSPIIEYAIDFDLLRQELSDVLVEGSEERYQFTWPDKKKSILLANAPIAKTLRPFRQESVDFDNTEHLYVEGDNLEVLKLLQETYLGKVKMIYIDPPYNTGKDFLYDDNFSQSVSEYINNSGQLDDEGNQLFQNTESNGRFHTDWLNMMYPRLRLVKNLLMEDGVVCISIGEGELSNVRNMCDEIFGVRNRICIFTWRSRSKPTNAGNSKYRPQKIAEYVLVYGRKSVDELIFNVVPAKTRTYPHEDGNGKYRTTTILTSNRGTFRRETMRFESNGFKPDEDYRWKAGKDTIDKLFDTGHIEFNEDGIPMEKKYSHEEQEPLYPIYTFVDPDLSGTAENGKTELNSLIGNRHGFDTVKPVQLLKYLLATFTKKEDIVLDIFSGTATTAQAVYELNFEQDLGLKIISVQVAEKCEKEDGIVPAFDTVFEIGKTRMIKVREKLEEIQREMPKGNNDYGFRVLKIDTSNMQDVYYTPSKYNQGNLFELEDNIKPDRTPEDLLFQVMLDLGVLLSSTIEETLIKDKKVFNVANGYLLACFDKDVTSEVITEIAKKQPYYAIFRDSSMANDSVATNFEQIFETYSPTTIRKVL